MGSQTTSIISLASETSQEEQTQEDNKMIEQERTETGRVSYNAKIELILSSRPVRYHLRFTANYLHHVKD